MVEIKPCPNPACLSKADVFPMDVFGLDDEPHGRQRVYCSNAVCLMNGPIGKNAAEAVALRNALPWNGDG